MATIKSILGLLTLLSYSAWTEAGVVKKVDGDNNYDKGDLTGTDQPENNNNNNLISADRNGNSIQINSRIFLFCPPTPGNAKSCVSHDRMWPKATDGKVYIPYVIADQYSSQELDVIKRAISSFSYSTCIRFSPRTNQKDYLYIQSLDGCHSCVGRQGNSQTVSLSHQGCMHYGTVQHELLHVLGFSHEQCRSDRDQHIRVLLQNVIKGEEFNFNKVNTLNQRTPYDYSSVMHYSRLAFSKDNNPTMVAVPDNNAVFGVARQMSQNDINRINLLYCRDESSSPEH